MSAELLIIDDEALFASSVARRLAQAGYSCTTAGRLAEARVAMANEPPRLVLLDVRLPDGSGLNFLEEIEMQSGLLKLDVIVLTAYGEISDAVEALKRGAADYLILLCQIEFPTSAVVI